MKPDCSIVLPAYNESRGLIPVVDEIASVMAKTSFSYEIVLVDDGSRDDTWTVIKELRAGNSSIKALRFARNFGHQLAVHAGIKATSGDMVAIMDSDGQDPADLLPRMFEKIKNDGYDTVNCIRKKRKEGPIKRACYFLFYRFYKKLVPFEMPLDSGDFSAFSRKVADIIAATSQHTPFIRGMRAWSGGRQFDLEYERSARQSGEPKYGLYKLIMLALDGITAFSKVPLRLSIVLGATISIMSIAYAIFVFIQRCTGWLVNPDTPPGWASQTFLIAVLGGMILTVLGIIGEYLGHIFDAVRGMPPYRIMDQEGFDKE